MPTLPEDLREPFDRFVRGPTLVRAALDGVDPGTLNRRVKGGDWSIRDLVMHVAENEMVQAVRFRMVIAGGETPLPVFDRGLWKRRLHYLWRDPEAAVSLYQQARYSNAELLQQCDKPSWERTGQCPELGTVTLAQLMRTAADHSDAEAARIREFREG